MSTTEFLQLNVFELNELKREIERRSSGPTRIVYVVTEWGHQRVFADFRCAALCFSDIAEEIMKDGACETGVDNYDKHKGDLVYGFRPVEITLSDFEAKVAQKYFDDICYEKRLSQ